MPLKDEGQKHMDGWMKEGDIVYLIIRRDTQMHANAHT